MTTDIIEGEAREVETRALVPVDQGMAATGAMALAALDDDEFDRRLAALEKGRDRVARIQRALMVRDVDYGVIPGTGTKPTLLKPGAEKLCQAYGLVADFTPTRTVGDAEREPALSYLTRCDLHLGSLDGPVVATGYGASNSWERKHRYRRGERLCPSCGKPAIIKGKAEYGGGWVCFKKKDGCGTKWPDGAPEIEAQSVGDVENPDPFDLDVVLAKMSEKRAFIDATLRATAASGLFTQDVEEMPRQPEGEWGDEPRHAAQAAPQGPARPTVAPDGGLVGKARTQGNQDYERRETPDGPVLPFRVGSQIVVAHGEDAVTALQAMRDAVLGQTVTVWGHQTDESFTDGKTKRQINYTILHLSRITAPEFEWPAQAIDPATDPAVLDAAFGAAS